MADDDRSRGAMTATAAVRAPDVPLSAMMARTFAVQGSWNYELMVGNGLGFCVEPALRLLDGGVDGERYRSALARECTYFNAHPYLSALAVGALARVELDQAPAPRIERFRAALCGPLGSVGDRLVWASWLPACALIGILLYGVGAGPVVVLTTFLFLYNAGHLWLRYWGIHEGWQRGFQVAGALAHPVLQHGPRYIGRAAAIVGGLALPLAAHRAIGGGDVWHPIPIGVAVGTPLVAIALVKLHGKAEGWRVVLLLLALLVLYSVVR